MKELLECIVRPLVDSPEDISINEFESEKSLVLELSVASDDMGKVIGKQGRIAKAIRTVMKAAAVKGNKRVIVEIVQ